MSFIEALKSVGGIKPCPNRKRTEGVLYEGPADFSCSCKDCHGTGQILDLATLLAKPNELKYLGSELLKAWFKTVSGGCYSGYPDELRQCVRGTLIGMNKDLYVVGPQRASNLVYEVARQLGGTAVVAENDYDDGPTMEIEYFGLRLSLTIPPDSTVLFVTDRYDKDELWNVVHAAGSGYTALPYILCLVSAVETHQPYGHPIIALHKE